MCSTSWASPATSSPREPSFLAALASLSLDPEPPDSSCGAASDPQRRKPGKMTRGVGASQEGPIAVVACVSTCVAAYGVYLGLPLILGALATQLNFSDAQIGWIGSAENGGLLLGSVAVSRLARSWRFRTIATLGMPLAILGDLVMREVRSFPVFLAVRLCAGFGGGLCYSAAIAALSRTQLAARNFSIFVFVLVIANSVELWLIPPIVSHWNVGGLYMVLAALYLLPLALAP